MGQDARLYFPYLPDHRQGYIDFFSEHYINKESVILEDGTSVQFPKDWTDEDADKWRKGMDLQRPDGYHATSMDLVGGLAAALVPNGRR